MVFLISTFLPGSSFHKTMMSCNLSGCEAGENVRNYTLGTVILMFLSITSFLSGCYYPPVSACSMSQIQTKTILERWPYTNLTTIIKGKGHSRLFVSRLWTLIIILHINKYNIEFTSTSKLEK